ncbi:MAG: DnaD domain protein [Tissierellia bacterium]|nr:DnaD domain protein [Tissierellia bacterium]
MSFLLGHLTLDLGETAVENIFISDFMPRANGSFVKVYLLGLRYAKENGINKTNKHIAKTLGLLESDVIAAWDYWEKQGIVQVQKEEGGEDSIIFHNLKQLYIKNVYQTQKPKVRKSFAGSMSDPVVANLLAQVDFYMRKTLPYQQKQDIIQWISDYNMPPQVIEEAFYYTTEMKNIYNLKYVETVVRNWALEGIRSLEAVEAAYKKNDMRYYRFRKVMKAIGLGNKPFVQGDFDTIQSWFEDLGFSMEIVLEGAKRSMNIANPNVGYINGVMKNWKEKGIKTIEDIGVLDIKEKTRSRKVPKGFHNFTQRSDQYTAEELEAIARKKRQQFRMEKDR